MTKIKENYRVEMADFYLKGDFIKFESYLYAVASRFGDDYNGGYWDMYVTNNGVFFMALEQNKEYRYINDNNYTDEILSGLEFGLVMSLFVYNLLAEYGSRYADIYYCLKSSIEEIVGEERAGVICRCID